MGPQRKVCAEHCDPLGERKMGSGEQAIDQAGSTMGSFERGAECRWQITLACRNFEQILSNHESLSN